MIFNNRDTMLSERSVLHCYIWHLTFSKTLYKNDLLKLTIKFKIAYDEAASTAALAFCAAVAAADAAAEAAEAC